VTPEVDAHAAEQTGAASRAVLSGRLWIVALVPLLLLTGLVAWIVRSGPADVLRSDGVPPVEKLTFQRVELGADGMRVTVLNDGPDPVTIAQVAVDDAFWNFQASGTTRLAHLGRTTLSIPYPWVKGETHVVRVITATGLTFDRTIAVAVESPHATVRSLLTFSLIGLYVGVIPVAIGMLWFPVVRSLGRAGLDFVLALTVGLLLFLLVDAAHERLESSSALPDSFQGVALFVFTAGAAYLALEAFGNWLRARRTRLGSQRNDG